MKFLKAHGKLAPVRRRCALLGAGSGNAALDVPFVAIELCAFALLLVAGAFARRARRVHLVVVVFAAVLLAPIAPLVWNSVLPPANGIEGAGRFLIGAPTTALVVGGSAMFLLRARRSALVGTAAVVWPVVAHATIAAAYWVWFLFS